MKRRLIAVAIALACFLTANVCVAAAAPSAERIITEKLQDIGVEDGTIPGFYVWSLGTITDCLEDMDEAMQSVGFEHDMAGMFQEAIDSTMNDFVGVQTDDEALDKLSEIINRKEYGND